MNKSLKVGSLVIISMIGVILGTTAAAITTIEEAAVGTYVTYYPNNTEHIVPKEETGADVDQFYNPSLTTSWRVLSNDGTNVELVSSDAVGSLTLGNSSSVERCALGYQYLVKVLNDFSKAYINSDYAESGRALGYSEGISDEILDIEASPLTWEATYGTGSVGEPYLGEYEDDVTILSENSMLASGYVWLAARYYTGNSTRAYFGARLITAAGELNSATLYYNYNDGQSSVKSYPSGVRPVVKLKNGISIAGGSGTVEDPYILGTSQSVQVTFDANAGEVDTSSLPTYYYDRSYGSLPIPTRTGYGFGGWYKEDTFVNLVTNSSIVETADAHTLYAKWITSTDDMPIGSYVTYVPSETTYSVATSLTGYTSAQTYTPSNTTLWRVLRKDRSKVEIMSDSSVGALYTQKVRNKVKVLNDISEAYVNPLYAVEGSGRGLGYKEGATFEEVPTLYKYSYKRSYTMGNTGFPYADESYVDDINIINQYDMWSGGTAWLASNVNSSGASTVQFGTRLLNDAGLVANTYTYACDSDGTTTSYTMRNNGVRPIVGLRNGIQIVSGSGTESDPYVLSETGGGTVNVTFEDYSDAENVVSVVSYGGTYGTLPTPTKDGYVFEGWYSDPTFETVVTADTAVTNTGDHTLYARYTGTLLQSVAVGSYVTYQPTNTEYTVSSDLTGADGDQMFNPSLTNTWQVFSTDGTNVELISTESVGSLVFGSDISAATAKAGWKNIVKVLNDISKAYINPDYAIDGRGLGFKEGSSVEEVDERQFPMTFAETYVDSAAVTNVPYVDTYYEDDVAVLTTNSLLHSADSVWLASRLIAATSSRTAFSIRRVKSDGTATTAALFFDYSTEGLQARSAAASGVRPIVKLREGIYIAGGDGTAENPYILEVRPELTVTFNNDGVETTDTVTYGDKYTSLPTPTKEGFAFGGWYKESDYRTLVNADSVVEEKEDHTLYARWITTTTDMPVGSYVTYAPISTSYTVAAADVGTAQTFDPSATTSWRVFYNDEETIELISTESVGDLTLGNSSSSAKTLAAYQNAVGTLNAFAAAYANPLYAISGRALGYDAERSVESIDTTTYPITYADTTGNKKFGFPYNDAFYMSDMNQLNLNNLRQSTGNIWLASRLLNTSGAGFSVRHMTPYGNVSQYGLDSNTYIYHLNSSETVTATTVTNGFRPIVSIRKGIQITGGSGTAADPYVLNPAGGGDIVVSFESNGKGTFDNIVVTYGQPYTNLPEDLGIFFEGWYTDSEFTTQVTSSDTVTLLDDHTLYAKWGTPEVGTYVAYYPNSTSYTVTTEEAGTDVEQTFNPSLTTSWRVFSNTNGIELISAETAGMLVIGGREDASRSEIVYRNYVQILNDFTAAYVNPYYARSARSLGYVQNSSIDVLEDSLTYADAFAVMSAYTDGTTDNQEPYEDTYYTTDMAVLVDKGMLDGIPQWMASRVISRNYNTNYGELSKMNFGGAYLSADGTTVGQGMFYSAYSDGLTAPGNYSAGMRPIIKLNSDAYIYSGSGTADDPYILTIAQPVQVNFELNDGQMDEETTLSVNYDRTYGTLPTPSKSNYAFGGWYLENDYVTRITENSIVETTETHTLYARWITSVTDMPIGSYIQYAPNVEEYTVDAATSGADVAQTFNPSLTTSWRVLKNADNVIDIMSAGSVGDLTLGTDVAYRTGLGTLNDIGEQYVNSDYAVEGSGRHLGYKEGKSIETISDETTLDWESMYVNGNNGVPYADAYGTEDYNALTHYDMLPGDVWLSQRRVNISGTATTFYLRSLNDVGVLQNNSFYVYNYDGTTSTGTGTHGVIPVVSLNSNLELSGGSGTVDDPYTLIRPALITWDWDTTGDTTKTVTLKVTDETTIAWGDGVRETVSVPENPDDDVVLTHTYGAEGVYTAGILDDVATKLDLSNDQSGEQVTSLNIAAATVLTELDSSFNYLEELDVSANSALTKLNCSNNYLTTLDVTQNAELLELDCGYNYLTSLDVSQNEKLTSLACYSNSLSGLSVSSNTALTYLDCSRNNLSALDVSANSELTYLDCAANNIGVLNVTGNANLETLYCGENTLVELDVSQNANLTMMCVAPNSSDDLYLNATQESIPMIEESDLCITSSENEIHVHTVAVEDPESGVIEFTWDATTDTTKTIVLQATGETTVYWGDGTTDTIDTTTTTLTHTYTTPDVYEVKIIDNVLTSLDISNDQAGENVTVLNVANATALTSLDCGYNSLTALNVSSNTSLTYLDCSNNKLSELSVTSNSALTYLDCGYNQLTALDVSQNMALTDLRCYSNQITTLNVSANTNLTYLNCSKNALTALDVAANTKLTHLDCAANALSTLNVDTNTALINLYCGYNQLQTLDVKLLSSLSILCCAQSSLQELYLTEAQAERMTIVEEDEVCITKGENQIHINSATVVVTDSEPETGAIVFTWDATTDTSKTISLTATGATTVYWGDGTTSSIDTTTTTLTKNYTTPGIYEVKIVDNVLTKFDVCQENTGEYISALTINGATNLTYLDCGYNQLTSLTVTGAPNLTYLACHSNQLTSLDVSNNRALTFLDCSKNNISGEFNVEVNTALTHLDCSANNISVLDVATNVNLVTFYCGYNNLTTLDVTTIQNLNILCCAQSSLQTLTLNEEQRGRMTVVYEINICVEERDNVVHVHSNTEVLPPLNVPATGAIEFTWTVTENETKTINFVVTAGTTINWGDGNTTAIDTTMTSAQHTYTAAGTYTAAIVDNVATSFGCNSMGVSALDVTEATALTYLDCTNNSLSSLTLPANLTELYCGGNNFSELDISTITNLSKICCVQTDTMTLYMTTEQDTRINFTDEESACSSITTDDTGHKHANTTIVIVDEEPVDPEIPTDLAIEFTWDATGDLTKSLILQTTQLIGIDWGDGNGVVAVDVQNGEEVLTKNYATEQSYTVKIYGNYVTMFDACSDEVGEKLTSLDVTAATALTYLDCGYGQLETLDVSTNVNLTHLACHDNQLQTLNVSNNTLLTFLDCSRNGLTTINVSANTELTHLDVAANALTAIDVTMNTKLVKFYCGYNQLTALNVEVNTALSVLCCTQPSPTLTVTLNAEQRERLEVVYEVDVCVEELANTLHIYEGTTVLPELTATGAIVWVWDTTAQLEKTITVQTATETTINWGDGTVETVAASTADLTLTHTYATEGYYTVSLVDDVVTKLDAQSTQIVTIDVTRGIALTYLQLNENQLTEINVTKNTALTSLYCGNNSIGSLDVSPNTALTVLACYNNQLTVLDVTQNTALTELNCHNNQLSSLDVTKNTALTTLLCNNNQLSSLDVTQNTALTKLNCPNNQLSSLDVTNNAALQNLDCSNNALGELNLTQNPALTVVKCYTNQLTTLDLTANIALIELYCGENELETLDVSVNTALSKICCVQSSMTTLYMNAVQMETIIFSAETVACGNITTDNTGHKYETTVISLPSAAVEITWDATGDTEKTLTIFIVEETILDWGDGTVEILVPSEDGLTLTHTYGTEESFTIRILDDVVLTVDCSNSGAGEYVSDIELSGATMMMELYCSGNQLTSLDLTQNDMLAILDCSGNALTGLTLTANTQLRELYCGNNQMTELDVSANKILRKLCCTQSMMTTLVLDDTQFDRMTIVSETTGCNSFGSTMTVDTAHKYTGTNITLSGVALTVKPNAIAWTNTKLKTAFDKSQAMLNDTTYGLDATGSTLLKTHLFKNSEWGAVTYLMNAIGRTPYRNNHATLTGFAASTASGMTEEEGTAWNTETGVKASTTHNVFGIYDMNGGRQEFVAAYIDGLDTDSVLSGSDKVKDVDKYTEVSDTMNYYGGALYETGNIETGTSWNGAAMQTTIDGTAYPFFTRGGSYYSSTNATKSDAMMYSTASDAASAMQGFRPVIIVKKATQENGGVN